MDASANRCWLGTDGVVMTVMYGASLQELCNCFLWLSKTGHREGFQMHFFKKHYELQHST